MTICIHDATKITVTTKDPSFRDDGLVTLAVETCDGFDCEIETVTIVVFPRESEVIPVEVTP